MSKNKCAASTKVLPLVYIGEDDLLPYEDSLGELMQKTNSKIEFNYSKQFFHIQARSHSTCDLVARHIKGFLSVFNTLLTDNFFKNTFCNMERFPSQLLVDTNILGLSIPSSANFSSNLSSPQIVRVTGRSISVLEDADDTDNISATVKSSNNSQVTSPGSQTTSPPVSSNPSTPQQQSIPQYYRGDTESEGDYDSNDELFSGQFTFARNVANPNDVLTDMPLIERKFPNHLKEVEVATDTECCLVPNSKTITITGPTQETVDDAIERFKQLQMIYKRRGKEPTCVPCIHPNPNDPRIFRLYFADLECYRYKDMVFVSPDVRRPLSTLLPVYNDPRTGQPSKPVDLIDIGTQGRTPTPRTPHPVNYTPSPRTPPAHAYQSPQPVSQTPPSASPSSSRAASPAQFESSLPAASWGSRTVMQVRPSVITPEAEQWKNRQQILPTSPPAANPADDFPSLPTKPAQKPSVQAPGKGMQRRVLRISSQKAPSPTAEFSPSTSIHDICRDYNLNNAKVVLTEGLDVLRGIPGEVQFGAKFGKVLWRNLPPAVQSKMWKFEDIKDIVMRENKVIPLFNNVTTTSEHFYNTMNEQFPPFSSRTAVFEFHAMARNQPSLDYQPVIMCINPGTVDYQKVILRKHRISEIDWVSLDRKFDFQMYLSAEELARKDVKPFTTFIKTLMINTTNYNMTFDNVENFLKVTHVYHRETTKHKLHFPFMLELTRVERIPLVPQTFNRISANRGGGEVWYDCEVFCTSHNEFFKRNMSLKVGKVATWTLQDIFGKDEQMLMEYLRCMLIVTENLEVTMDRVMAPSPS